MSVTSDWEAQACGTHAHVLDPDTMFLERMRGCVGISSNMARTRCNTPREGGCAAATPARGTCDCSIVCTDCHFQNLDVASSFCLAFDDFIQALECARLDEAHGFPFSAYGVLTLDVLHETENCILDCA